VSVTVRRHAKLNICDTLQRHSKANQNSLGDFSTPLRWEHDDEMPA